jgi:hypothetical protein
MVRFVAHEMIGDDLDRFLSTGARTTKLVTRGADGARRASGIAHRRSRSSLPFGRDRAASVVLVVAIDLLCQAVKE